MKTPRYNPIIGGRDQEILLFLWKFRVATFMAIKTKFFAKTTPERAYKRLRKLVLAGFIDRFVLSGTIDRVYGLGPRGMAYLQERLLPELKAKVRKSQSPYHDLLSSAALLGEWFLVQPEGVQIVSEQELRQTDVLEIPRDLRKQQDHFSDGIWIFKNGKESRGFALEVETTDKSYDRYVAINTFYVGQQFFEHVIWIVPSQPLAKKIHEASREYSNLRSGIHIFMLLEEFEKRGWHGRLLNKSLVGMTLADVMHARLDPNWQSLGETMGKLKGAKWESGGKNAENNILLNFRLSIARLRRYGGPPKKNNADSVL